uniref:Uncharacterized protein n=1 Tax=La France disease virus TaxID=28373 RepID=Q83039_9VIRU|nr:unknown [La France disease virus]
MVLHLAVSRWRKRVLRVVRGLDNIRNLCAPTHRWMVCSVTCWQLWIIQLAYRSRVGSESCCLLLQS